MRHAAQVKDPTARREAQQEVARTRREVRGQQRAQTISELESGQKLPSLKLAEVFAAILESRVAEVWWPPRTCACGCNEETLGEYVEHHAAGHRTAEIHRQELETYKQRYGRIGDTGYRSCRPAAIAGSPAAYPPAAARRCRSSRGGDWCRPRLLLRRSQRGARLARRHSACTSRGSRSSRAVGCFLRSTSASVSRSRRRDARRASRSGCRRKSADRAASSTIEPPAGAW